MLCRSGRLRVGKASSGSIVCRRGLAVHLAERTGRRTKALRGGVGFRSVFRTRDLITLNLDGLLCFDQVVVQLLECSVLLVNLVIQVTDFFEQQLFLRFDFTESRLVLSKIIVHVLVCVVQVRNLRVLVQ